MSRTKFWGFQFLKMPILLMLPYVIHTYSERGNSDVWVESFLWRYDSGYGFSFEFNLFILISAYIIAIPGFYYVHKLRQTDLEKSKWKMGVGIIAVTQLLPSIIPIPYITPYDMYFPYWNFFYLAPFYCMIGYVIIPIFNRKIQYITTIYMRGYAVSSRRERIKHIYIPLWIAVLVLMISPIVLISNTYDQPSVSEFYTIISLFLYSNCFVDTYDTSYSLNISISFFPMYLLSGIFCIFNILFVEKLIQYYKGETMQMDVLKYGLLGAIWPFFMWYTIESLFAPPYARTTSIPLPFLFIIGLIALKLGSSVHHTCRRVGDQIWEDEEPTSPIIEDEYEVIDVPIWYILISRFRKNNRACSPPNKVESPSIEETLSDEIKVPWWYSIISRFRKGEVEAWDPDEEIDDPWSST